MAISRTKKEEVVAKVASLLKSAASVVFVNFHKLPVADTVELRSLLRKEGVSYVVAKKTLVQRALSESSVEGEAPELTGELALASGDDLIAPARGVHEFAKKHLEQVSIMGGIFEGRYMSAKEMQEIAAIPSLQTLRAQFVMLVNSPLQRLAVALDQIAVQKS